MVNQSVIVTLIAMSMGTAVLMCLMWRTVLVSVHAVYYTCPATHQYILTVEECETGEVRLVGGVTNSTGRLEVCGNGVWGRVCNRFQYWGPDNARVVCRQLGFSEEGMLCYHNVGRRYIGMARMPASRNTFSKPTNSQTKEL